MSWGPSLARPGFCTYKGSQVVVLVISYTFYKRALRSNHSTSHHINHMQCSIEIRERGSISIGRQTSTFPGSTSLLRSPDPVWKVMLRTKEVANNSQELQQSPWQKRLLWLWAASTLAAGWFLTAECAYPALKKFVTCWITAILILGGLSTWNHAALTLARCSQGV